VLSIVLSAAFFAYIIFVTFNDFTRLRALGGIAIFMTIGFVFSSKRSGINWRPVICGAIFQFLLGVLFIRWPVGRNIFACFGEKVSQFLSYGMNGASFVYGGFLVDEKAIFAFAVLPTIYFFSLCISVAYYLGAMQWVLFKLGWILQSILGTTVCESVNAAGNIFLGMSEGPLVIRPYIKHLTHSEIHAIMVSGFSTVSGSVMVAYISFGAEPAHLITASVMAAPASLFFAKLCYPEQEETKTSSDNIQMEKS
jgi:pyrimidine nucleoside transport protein